jgi:UDP-N-acetylglucosamine 2-epimerase (non-hydrolysing)
MKDICCIVGTRPNLIKLNCLYKSLRKYFNVTLIHTGQHKSSNMNTIFFQQLNIPYPNYYLNTDTSLSPTGSMQNKLYNNNLNTENIEGIIQELLSSDNLGQIGDIRQKLKPLFQNMNPNLVIVFGDVTSTLAGALCAFDMNIPIAHIESGLRSGDLTMPEEINRILVDYMTTYYFISEPSGMLHLIEEGYNENLYIVGNTMIDTLYSIVDKCTKPIFNNYILITLHRPSNVDNTLCIDGILHDLKLLSGKYTIIFPIHPRTRKNINIDDYIHINFIEPQGYIDFISLIKYSQFVITDSGGIQEETTALHIRCFTLRNNTERPFTLMGTNSLISSINDIDYNCLNGINNMPCTKKNSIQTLWDGNASDRITNLLVKLL